MPIGNPIPDFKDIYTTDILIKKDTTGAEALKIVISDDTYAAILVELGLIK
jgi:hypothetical protein